MSKFFLRRTVNTGMLGWAATAVPRLPLGCMKELTTAEVGIGMSLIGCEQRKWSAKQALIPRGKREKNGV